MVFKCVICTCCRDQDHGERGAVNQAGLAVTWTKQYPNFDLVNVSSWVPPGPAPVLELILALA